MTSGVSYRQWMQGKLPQHHLIDPRTGKPAESDLFTVTVIHARAIVAEAAAKTLLLLGSRDGLNWLQTEFATECAALFVLKCGEILTTPNFHSVHEEQITIGEISHEA